MLGLPCLVCAGIKAQGHMVLPCLSCYCIVKQEEMGFLREFFINSSFKRNLNVTFLVLIPKKGGAKDLKYFIFITLVGGLHKLLAKVLANRLKKVV